MTRTLNAMYDGKVFHPDEPIELKPNTRVRVTIETVNESKTKPQSFLKTARSLKISGPSDWSARFEDYLYKDVNSK